MNSYMTVPKFVKTFFDKDPDELKGGRKHRKYHISIDGKKLYYQDSLKYNPAFADMIAAQLRNGMKVGNASTYKFCGHHVVPSLVQLEMMRNIRCPMLPFNVFKEAHLDIQDAEVVEQGKEEELLMPKQERDAHGVLVDIDVHATKFSRKELKRQDWMKSVVSCPITNNSDYREYYNGNRYKTTYVDARKLEQRHFVGAMLLKVKRESGAYTYFLFDIDRNESKHYRMNAFLVQLRAPATTIKQAYELLKPAEVVAAEKKGLSVRRQGEWFFIPQPATFTEKLKAMEKQYNKMQDKLSDLENKIQDEYGEDEDGDHYYSSAEDDKRYTKLEAKYKKTDAWNAFDDFSKLDGAELKAGDNRANMASEAIKIGKQLYVKGLIEHEGREHEPITLQQWCKPVPNTATKSFTIEGNID